MPAKSPFDMLVRITWNPAPVLARQDGGVRTQDLASGRRTEDLGLRGKLNALAQLVFLALKMPWPLAKLPMHRVIFSRPMNRSRWTAFSSAAGS